MAPAWTLRFPSSELAAWYRANGWWTDQTLAELVETGLQRAAARPARIRSRLRPFSGTVGDLGDMGRRLSAALGQRGIGAGDVVAFQLPNWAEAVACAYGLLGAGVVVVPVVHAYGPKEVAHVLRQSRARAIVTTERFGRHDYLEGLEEAAATLPDLEVVVVVQTGNGPTPRLGQLEVVSWSEVLSTSPGPGTGGRTEAPDPDEPALIGYTSGATAEPKGVVHTHRTFLADQRTWSTFLGRDTPAQPGSPPRASLTSAPIGHITGLSAILRPLIGHDPLDLMDAWDPGGALDAIVSDGVAVGGGAPYFLLSLLDHPDFDPARHLPGLRQLTMGGAPVPRELVERATALGISITRAYGSTEHPSTTASLHSDPLEKRSFTDGRLLSGSEIKILDPLGRPVPRGQSGLIHSRGPELFAGYTDADLTDQALDHEGWYDTGDCGVLDEEGYLTITERVKDIIIRGGENVSAAEVEGVLAAMEGIAEVAVVAAPDLRYGEHGAAVLRLAPGYPPPDLESVRAHLSISGLGRQKWPEEVRVVDDFPRTASGKIHKRLLRQALQEPGDGRLPFERAGGS